MVIISACNQNSVQPIQEAIPVPEPTTTTQPISATDNENALTPSLPDTRQLVLWVPEFLDPNPDTNAGRVLDAAMTQFKQANPNVTLDVKLKAEIGEAGLFQYLRSAQKVAPSILPDIIAIDTSHPKNY